jgi:hypothetical protein
MMRSKSLGPAATARPGVKRPRPSSSKFRRQRRYGALVPVLDNPLVAGINYLNRSGQDFGRGVLTALIWLYGDGISGTFQLWFNAPLWIDFLIPKPGSSGLTTQRKANSTPANEIKSRG